MLHHKKLQQQSEAQTLLNASKLFQAAVLTLLNLGLLFVYSAIQLTMFQPLCRDTRCRNVSYLWTTAITTFRGQGSLYALNAKQAGLLLKT